MVVIKLPLVGFILFCLVLGSSCRSSYLESPDSNTKAKETFSGRAFDSSALEYLNQRHKENLILGKKLEAETKWLRMHLKMVEAELKANRTKEMELKLLLEMAKYDSLSDRIPGGEGFITNRQKIIWDERLNMIRKEYDLSLAKVRLLQRDLDELRDEFTERGVHLPTIPSLNTKK